MLVSEEVCHGRRLPLGPLSVVVVSDRPLSQRPVVLQCAFDIVRVGLDPRFELSDRRVLDLNLGVRVFSLVKAYDLVKAL